MDRRRVSRRGTRLVRSLDRPLPAAHPEGRLRFDRPGVVCRRYPSVLSAADERASVRRAHVRQYRGRRTRRRMDRLVHSSTVFRCPWTSRRATRLSSRLAAKAHTSYGWRSCASADVRPLYPNRGQKLQIRDDVINVVVCQDNLAAQARRTNRVLGLCEIEEPLVVSDGVAYLKFLRTNR